MNSLKGQQSPPIIGGRASINLAKLNRQRGHMKYLPLIRNALVVVALCVPVSMAVAAFNAETAEARSYQAKAVNKANNWAYNRYRSALYIQSECYAAGYG